jgi:hypothetical protein
MKANFQQLPMLICFTVSICVTASDLSKTIANGPLPQENTKIVSPSAGESFDFHQIRGRQSQHDDTGMLEGELDLTLVGKSRIQGMTSFGHQWSNGAHLLWDGVIGESMKSSFEVEASGVYDVSIQLTLAGDYGIFRMDLPQSSITQEIDLYSTRVELAPLVVLKNLKLDAGSQPIEFKLTGANSKARKFQNRGYLMALDFIRLSRKNSEQKTTSVPGNQTEQKRLQDSVVTNKPNSETNRVLTTQQVAAFTKTFCTDCHNADSQETDVDFAPSVDGQSWHNSPELVRQVRDVLSDHEMPPVKTKQPSTEQRNAVVMTLNSMLLDFIRNHQTAAPTAMRRMTRYEYNNAVRDLLQLRGDIYPLPEKTLREFDRYFQPATGHSPRAILVGNRTLGKNQVERQILSGVNPFAIDLQAEGGFNNRGEELGLSPILLESLLRLGRSIVHSPEFDGYCGLTGSLFSSPETKSSKTKEEVTRERIGKLLERAFRTPIDDPTTNRYYDYFTSRHEQTGSFRHAMKDVVAAILASPRFVYLAESPANGDDSLLGGYELATRLSIFLWSSIPDEELLELARNGTLLDPKVLDSQTQRMLTDPKCHALTQNFARQWLRLDQLVTAVPDFDRFPRYYSRIGCEQWKFGLQMMVEPLLLFDSILMEDRSIMLLVDCNYAYRSDELQSWYNDEVPFGNRENRNRFNTNQQQYIKRKLTDRREGGVITSAAIMTMTSSPLRTNPITRGAWVATVILNRPPPPPPDTVPPIEADDREIESAGLTLRQRLTQHQTAPTCAACHSQIDPLGFVLENYDAVGRWRGTYASGLKIDSSGELLGKLKFQNVVELKDALLKHPEFFMRAFSEHMLSYALGRELKLSDEPAVEKIVDNVVEDRGQFTTVVREIVQSRAFRYSSDESEPTKPNPATPAQGESP